MKPLLTETPLYTAAAAVYPYHAPLQQKVTFIDRFGEPYSLARKIDGKLHIARRAAIVVNDERAKGVPVKFKSKFKPRNKEQSRVVAESTHRLKADGSHIFQARTGFGKTICAVEIMCRLGLATIIVVTKSDLAKGWREALMSVAGLSADEIGEIRGANFVTKGKKVVIAQVQTLGKERIRAKQKELSRFGLSIWDEVHRIGADTFQDAVFNVPAKLRLGLTATPKRTDGRDSVFSYHIGPVEVVANLDTIGFRVIVYKTNWQVPRKSGGEQIHHSPGKTGHLTRILSGNMPRNQVICNFILTARKKGRKCLIFSDTIKHLTLLAELLEGRGVDDSEMGFYISPASAKKAGLPFINLAHSAKQRIILATYAMTSEGTDIPDVDSCVLATPRSNVEQIVGRTLRWLEGKKEPVVLDMADMDSWVFQKYLDKRIDFYRARGAQITFKSAA